ncbi:MAG: hypothetical protein ACOH2A_11495 [Sphingobacteriaceae bacterium]
MKNCRFKITVFFSLIFSISAAYAQNYEVLNYNMNGTPVNGVKIKTKMPFTSGSPMPFIKIDGYNYATGEPIGLSLCYYVYGGAFIRHAISSWGAYTPEISLSNEDGLVTIFINDKSYFQRFKVSIFSKGKSEQSTWFRGWTVVDQSISGFNTTVVPYVNKLSGNVTIGGTSIFKSDGTVGIGTLVPKGYKLAVGGNMIAESIKVKLQGTWPDDVFDSDYSLITLSELNAYLKIHKHLPEFPSADEIKADGINLGEINKLLTKQVEELTLHLIEQHEAVQNTVTRLMNQEARTGELEKHLKLLGKG